MQTYDKVMTVENGAVAWNIVESIFADGLDLDEEASECKGCTVWTSCDATGTGSVLEYSDMLVLNIGENTCMCICIGEEEAEEEQPETRQAEEMEDENMKQHEAQQPAPKYGPYEAPYWRRKWESEETQQRRKDRGAIDYGEVLAAGSEWFSYRAALAEQTKKYGTYITYAKRELYDAYALFDKADRVLWTLAQAVNIPADAIKKAARIEERYYNRGGTLLIDARALIESQID